MGRVDRSISTSAHLDHVTMASPIVLARIVESLQLRCVEFALCWICSFHRTEPRLTRRKRHVMKKVRTAVGGAARKRRRQGHTCGGREYLARGTYVRRMQARASVVLQRGGRDRKETSCSRNENVHTHTKKKHGTNNEKSTTKKQKLVDRPINQRGGLGFPTKFPSRFTIYGLFTEQGVPQTKQHPPRTP